MRVLVAVVVAVTMGAAALVLIGTTTDSAPKVFASDSFSRKVANNWNSADTGGGWTLDLTATASDFDVTGTAGTILLPAVGFDRSAALLSVSAQDLDLRFRVAIDKAPTSGNAHIYGLVRRTSTRSFYSVNLRIAPNGQVFAGASSHNYVLVTDIGAEHRVTGLTNIPGSFVWVRAQLSGTNPTVIRVRAWADGDAEPTTWLYRETDYTATLQAAGCIELAAHLRSDVSNAPILVTFDDLSTHPLEPLAGDASQKRPDG